MYKNLIFDYDGTLGDSYPLLNEALQHALRLHGIAASETETMRELKISVGHAARKYAAEASSAEELLRDMYAYYDTIVFDRCRLCPGVRALLDTAGARGIRCFVYTHTGGVVSDYLTALGIRAHFTDLMTGDEDFPRKPAPAALLALCARNGIDPAEALMIGDRDIDIAAGINAGIDGCLFDPDGYYADTEVPVKYRVHTMDRIIDFLA